MERRLPPWHRECAKPLPSRSSRLSEVPSDTHLSKPSFSLSPPSLPVKGERDIAPVFGTGPDQMLSRSVAQRSLLSEHLLRHCLFFAQLRLKQVRFEEGEQVGFGEDSGAGFFLSLWHCCVGKASCACFQSCGKQMFWTVSSWTGCPPGPPPAWRTCSSGRDSAGWPWCSAACRACH